MAEKSAHLKVDGKRVELKGMAKIGRSSSCLISIEDHLASREHAMVVFDETKGRWMVVDLGSTNGTYLNGRRIATPMELFPEDEISVGSKVMEFKGITGKKSLITTVNSDNTILSVKKSNRWLLLADVKDSTRLQQELPDSEFTFLVRSWVELCQPVIERSGGLINEYTGDGFLAFWLADQTDLEKIIEALNHLAMMETGDLLEFRVIVHLAEIAAGAAVSSGIDKMAGSEVNYIFKCEKAVRESRHRVILTTPAAEKIRTVAQVKELLRARVDGFITEDEFFAFLPSSPAAALPTSFPFDPEHQGSADDEQDSETSGQ